MSEHPFTMYGGISSKPVVFLDFSFLVASSTSDNSIVTMLRIWMDPSIPRIINSTLNNVLLISDHFEFVSGTIVLVVTYKYV